MYITSNTTFKDYIDYYCDDETKKHLEKYFNEYIEMQNQLNGIDDNDDTISELQDEIDFLREKIVDIESEAIDIKDTIQDISINDIIVKLNHIIDIAQEV